MAAWEYLVLSVKSGMLDSDDPLEAGPMGGKVGRDKLQPSLNKLGAEGWEVTSTSCDGKGIITQIVLKKQK
jgi:hypothetical protein